MQAEKPAFFLVKLFTNALKTDTILYYGESRCTDLKKGDIALIIIALLILALWLVPSKSGEKVSIFVDGEIYKTLPLDENTEITVESRFGTNTVVVRDKKVFVTDADCPDKLCEKSEISKSGSIVCLPNRLSVIIEGGKNDEKIDVVI